MKDLKTLTEKELLTAAYYHLLDIWYREEKINDSHKALYNEDSTIYTHRIAKLKPQIEELNDRLLEIENAE